MTKTHSTLIARTGAIITLSLITLTVSRANAAEFIIDPARSSITLSGSALSFPIQEQAAGSLTTKFEGTINATQTGSTIAFTGSSSLAAQNSGSWQPKANGAAGSDPANYGGKASAGFLGSVVAAVRNAKFDVTSPAVTLTGNQFSSASLVFQFLTNSAGSLDYSVTGLTSKQGSIALAGIATNRVSSMASLTSTGNVQTLTIPIASDFFFKVLSTDDVKLTLAGQIVATRSMIAGDSTFDTWATARFAGKTDAAIVGPNADPDKDGIANFVEFAFGLNPVSADASFAPLKASITVDAAGQNTGGAGAIGQRILQFVRPKGLVGVKYGLRTSDDLAFWTDLNASTEISDAGVGQELVVVRDTAPVDLKRGRFVVLTVSKN